MLAARTKKITRIIGIIVIIVILYFFGIFRILENIATKIINPVSSGFYSFSSSLRKKYNEQTNKEDLNGKIIELEQQLNGSREDNVHYKILEDENRLLREHLRFLEKNNYEYIMANIISRGEIGKVSAETDTVLLDRGKNDGIYDGLAVVSSQGTIIGKVVEVKDNISKVYLSNNSSCKLAATVMGEEKTSGITEGVLGLTVAMKFIPQDKNIAVDDLVVTSGLEQAIPRGLVVGKVIAVNKESNELWQSATIETVTDPEDLIIVSILLP